MAKEVWQSIDHAAISHKGYQQTGPLAPLTGPIYMKDLCRDLRDVVKAMCPHDDPAQIGTQIKGNRSYMRAVQVSAKVTRTGRQQNEDFLCYSAISHNNNSLTTSGADDQVVCT